MSTQRTKTVTKHCAVCGTPFQVCPPGKTSRFCYRTSSDKFCSPPCRNHARYRRGAPCSKLTMTQAAYIAGFLDGEGSIILYRRETSISMRVVFSNTKINALEWIKKSIGVGVIITHRHENPRHSDSSHLQLQADAAESLLSQILPYLIIKKEQAEIAIDFHKKLRDPKQKSDPSWQVETMTKIKSLNQRNTVHAQLQSVCYPPDVRLRL